MHLCAKDTNLDGISNRKCWSGFLTANEINKSSFVAHVLQIDCVAVRVPLGTKKTALSRLIDIYK
jgi:hypothetical protein